MDDDKLHNLEDAWLTILPQLELLCKRIGGNDNRGDEIFQRACIRVVRGLPSFRGESSLMTWASTIARHERDRLFAQEIAEKRRRMPLDADALAEVSGRATNDGIRFHKAAMLVQAARMAASSGELSAFEARVVLARLNSPTLTWREIGATLSTSAEACAQAHCRAILALRVYVFTQRPELLGGMQAIEEGFARAKTNTSNPMTPEEQLAFSQIVVKRAVYTRRGWREALRSACLKVSRQLEFSDD